MHPERASNDNFSFVEAHETVLFSLFSPRALLWGAHLIVRLWVLFLVSLSQWILSGIVFLDSVRVN